LDLLFNNTTYVFPFIIWIYGSAIVIIRGWGWGFGSRREDIVAWSDNSPSFTVLGFIAVVANRQLPDNRAGITTPLLKLPITKVVIKVNIK
jgi:hypothetical protein